MSRRSRKFQVLIHFHRSQLWQTVDKPRIVCSRILILILILILGGFNWGRRFNSYTKQTSKSHDHSIKRKFNLFDSKIPSSLFIFSSISFNIKSETSFKAFSMWPTAKWMFCNSTSDGYIDLWRLKTYLSSNESGFRCCRGDGPNMNYGQKFTVKESCMKCHAIDANNDITIGGCADWGEADRRDKPGPIISGLGVERINGNRIPCGITPGRLTDGPGLRHQSM